MSELGAMPRRMEVRHVSSTPTGRRGKAIMAISHEANLWAWPGPPCEHDASFERRYSDARFDIGREHLLTEREDDMPDSVYKVIELIGSSNESWEKAAANAVEQAAKSLRDLRVAEVVKLDIQLDAKGKVEAYRAKLNVSFKFEGT
jgi:flavin-binding protein dodecin